MNNVNLEFVKYDLLLTTANTNDASHFIYFEKHRVCNVFNHSDKFSPIRQDVNIVAFSARHVNLIT